MIPHIAKEDGVDAALLCICRQQGGDGGVCFVKLCKQIATISYKNINFAQKFARN